MSWAIWITGPPGSGKSTIARAVEAELRARGRPVAPRLELDEIRKAITPEARYSDGEREVVYRALAYLAGGSWMRHAGAGRTPPLTGGAGATGSGARSAVRRGPARLPAAGAARARAGAPARPRAARHLRARRPARRDRARRRRALEPALAPELAIDTSAEPVAESVARSSSSRSGSSPRRRPRVPARMRAPSRAGRSGSRGVPAGTPASYARHVAERLQARGARASVLASGSVKTELLAGRPAGAAERDIVDRVVAYAAKLLTEAGVSVIVDAPASRKATRQAARGMIPAFAEIRLVGPAATRPGQEGEPDVTADDEESAADAQLAVRADDGDVERVAEQVLLVIQRLAATGSGARRRSADEPGQRGSRGDGGGPA